MNMKFFAIEGSLLAFAMLCTWLARLFSNGFTLSFDLYENAGAGLEVFNGAFYALVVPLLQTGHVVSHIAVAVFMLHILSWLISRRARIWKFWM